MSLYNRLFGENPDATVLIGMLSLTRHSFGRYRDAFLNKNGKSIIIVTRIGGKSNKKSFNDVYENLKKHPCYVYDVPDELDSTYQYFIFNVPDKYLFTASKMIPKDDFVPVGKKFEKEIEESKIPGSDAEKKMIEIGDYILNQVLNGNNIIDM